MPGPSLLLPFELCGARSLVRGLSEAKCVTIQVGHLDLTIAIERHGGRFQDRCATHSQFIVERVDVLDPDVGVPRD
jgi:hypothetical protein